MEGWPWPPLAPIKLHHCMSAIFQCNIKSMVLCILRAMASWAQTLPIFDITPKSIVSCQILSALELAWPRSKQLVPLWHINPIKPWFRADNAHFRSFSHEIISISWAILQSMDPGSPTFGGKIYKVVVNIHTFLNTYFCDSNFFETMHIHSAFIYVLCFKVWDLNPI